MLLSRVAGRIYWAARYIERAEDTARLVRAHGELMADLPTQVQTRWEPLVDRRRQRRPLRDLIGTTPSQSRNPESQSQSRSQSQSQRGDPVGQDIEPVVATFLISDRNNPSSVVSCVRRRSREPAHDARHVATRRLADVNDLYLYVTTEADRGVDRRVRERFLSRVIADGRRLDGVMATAMTHDEAYVMWRLGGPSSGPT